MSFNLGTAVGYLMLDTSGFESGFKRAETQLKTFTNKSKSWDKRFAGLSSGLITLGSNLTKSVTLPLVGLGTAAAKSAIDFESAFAGVRKTVDATEEEYSELEKSIIEMSNRMPQSAADIASVMEIAGQLGIRGRDNLLSFTETMIRLGDSTNLSSEEAATAIARIMNIMGTSTEDVGRFGSTIVDLGNNFATTESEITEMANRLAAGGKLAGLTEPQILALATAMSSVGINAEAGGTAMTQTFNAIEKAVANGGEKLQGFADVAGMTSEEFAAAWENDPITAIQAFIQGLGKLEEQGGSAVLALDDLGLSGIRQSDMLKSLSQSGDLLTDALETANGAWEENDALTQESETRYETLASKIQILWNNVKNLAKSFGDLLLPVIEDTIDFIKRLIEWLDNMPDSLKDTIVKIAEFVAIFGPVLVVIGKVAGAIKKLIGIFTGVTSPIGLIITIIALLVAAFIYLWNTSEDFRNFWINLWEAIKNAAKAAADWVVQAVKDVVQFFKNLPQTIADIWNNIKTTVSEKIQEIITAIAEWAVNLYNSAVNAWNQFWDGAKSIWEQIVAWISESWNSVVDTVTNFGQNLYDAGASIFSSFWDGLVSVWESIASWVSEKVSWIANALSNALGSVSSHTHSSGSYATGIDYIPSDRYVKVHEGEAILSKEQNRNRNNSPSGSFTMPIVLDVTNKIDGMTLARNQYKYNLIVDNNHGPKLIKT